MLKALLTVIIIMQAADVLCCPVQALKDRTWRPATYRGLKIGKSSRSDMLRVLGKPLSSSPSADQDPPYPISWNDYGHVTVDTPGTLAVEVDSRNNRIVGISISPDRMTREEAIKSFGNDYLLMGYEFCKGTPADAESGPVYENPKSTEIDYLEYRNRGIAIHLDHEGMVNAIYYVDKPIGLSSKAGCKQALQRYRMKSKRR